MSAYLFIMVKETLTQLLHMKVLSNDFLIHPRCHSTLVTSLMFADDLIIFTKPELTFINSILQVLDSFYQFSGLKINLQKSHILTSGITQSLTSSIINLTGLQPFDSTTSYLGIPLATSRITKAHCMPIFSKITARMNL